MNRSILNRISLLSLLGWALLIAGPVCAKNLQESVQTVVDGDPFLAQHQLKMRVMEAKGGCVTLELSEGPKVLRDLFRKGIELDGACLRDMVLKEDELKPLRSIRKAVKTVRGMKGVNEVVLTGALSSLMDPAENDCAQTDRAGGSIKGGGVKPDERQAIQSYRKAALEFSENLKENVQAAIDADPLLAQYQLKIRVAGEKNGCVTLELSEGPKVLRDLFRKGIELDGASLRDMVLREDEVKSLRSIRKAVKTVRGIKGVNEVVLTGALNSLIDPAENDYAQACQQLSQGDASGREEAIKLLRKAAEAGLPSAQTDLAGFYIMGSGVEPDERQAIEWYRQAAEKGEPRAQFNLGKMIALGRGTPQDYAQAIQWYRKAAEQDRQLVPQIKSLNALASLLATCPQTDLRDGKAALECAQKALLLDPQNGPALENLAAAYAQSGDFTEAVAQQKKWITRLENTENRDSSAKESLLAKAQKRLSLYQKNQVDIEQEQDEAMDK